MKSKQFHPWDVTPAEAIQIQKDLRSRIVTRSRFRKIRIVAGVDISVRGDTARAAVVVLKYPDMIPLDQATVTRRVMLPYIPGLLSFRESPSILKAFEKLSLDPDLIMVDGQGIAHPRRFGIASHLGLLLDRPSIGCAKTRLIGTYQEPGEKKGAFSCLYDGKEVIGAAVRSRDATNVLFVSTGHRVGLEDTIRIVLECCLRYRLPEPTRLAHQVAGGAVLSFGVPTAVRRPQ